MRLYFDRRIADYAGYRRSIRMRTHDDQHLAPCQGRLGFQSTADPADPRGECMLYNEAAFDMGHATTERCAGHRQSIGMHPYLLPHISDAQERSRRRSPRTPPRHERIFSHLSTMPHVTATVVQSILKARRKRQTPSLFSNQPAASRVRLPRQNRSSPQKTTR